jgi:hypothetical protein
MINNKGTFLRKNDAQGNEINICQVSVECGLNTVGCTVYRSKAGIMSWANEAAT